LISVLEGKNEFSFQTRNRVDELVEEFPDKIENNIHEMLCDNDPDTEPYRGLDSDRDTEAEIETDVRFFSNVLSRKGGPNNDFYPIDPGGAT
jgi:hypothetical protein